MNFLDEVRPSLILKNTIAVLSALILTSNPLLEANSVPERLGLPKRISPIPGPANPDPIHQNLVLVMDDHYQLPYYPGGAPDYLSQLYYFSNFYIGAGLVFNPCDDSIMHISFGQNVILDQTDTFYPLIGTNTFATSMDRGLSWSYGPPIEQIIPLGGTISQTINASLGPGLATTYAKNGTLYAFGRGFYDMRANLPNQVPLSGALFSASKK